MEKLSFYMCINGNNINYSIPYYLKNKLNLITNEINFITLLKKVYNKFEYKNFSLFLLSMLTKLFRTDKQLNYCLFNEKMTYSISKKIYYVVEFKNNDYFIKIMRDIDYNEKVNNIEYLKKINNIIDLTYNLYNEYFKINKNDYIKLCFFNFYYLKIKQKENLILKLKQNFSKNKINVLYNEINNFF